MFWELLQKFRRPKDFLGCPRLLGSCWAVALLSFSLKKIHKTVGFVLSFRVFTKTIKLSKLTLVFYEWQSHWLHLDDSFLIEIMGLNKV